ncbi:MAG TPA: acetylxylan esterase [Flavitalea sp.]|nr:acetylxylan esterase [Flavitalea sp.]
MKGAIFYCILFAAINLYFSPLSNAEDRVNGNRILSVDSLPAVLAGNHADLTESRLRNEAVMKFTKHQLPDNKTDWNAYRSRLKARLIEKAGIAVDHKLPLDIRETGEIQMNGYKIKNIAFQTIPGIYATANLFIPDGNGPFPAIVHMLGHWRKGKIDRSGPQQVGHSFALSGYVCLTIDPWGAGERATTHGDFEYHGANLGASLMNIGETLLGRQVVDNMRGIDLLSAMPNVDATRIGATGASGGGNQTMWLVALDERVKAAMPVVSVGSFESYIMRSNCVCELELDGFTLTEEAGVLALVAPRAIKMCNHEKESNPTFYIAEMLRTYGNALPVFKMLGVENNIAYETFDLTHGYWKENREAALGWFDLHLKGIGDGSSKKEVSFDTIPEEKLMVYPKGKRDPAYITTAVYARNKGAELKKTYLGHKTFDPSAKRKELKEILRIHEPSTLKKAHSFKSVDGWERIALETSDNKLIPVLLRSPSGQSQEYIIFSHAQGKRHIANDLLDEAKKKGLGIAIVDLSGTGETTRNNETGEMTYHTLSRSELWLGRSMLGEWAKELSAVADYVKTDRKAKRIRLDGTKEAGLAALFLSAVEGKGDELILRDAPVSYLFDNRESVDFYSMAIHLPGFLKWGDVSLAAALSGKNITLINPLSMSGRSLSPAQLKEYNAEFEMVRTRARQAGKTIFQ